MRLLTYRTASGTSAGRQEGDEVVTLPYTDVGALLADDDWEARAGQDGQRQPLAGLDLAPVVPTPSKVFCVGLNYLLHVQEGSADVPEYPTLFAKFTDALTGPHDDITVPAATSAVDWEAEMVVVIGRTVRDADEATAEAAIAGFTVGNDLSMRDWQRRTLQWLQGKTWDRAPRSGRPWSPRTRSGSARPDLAISCLVDGEVMQDARTSSLIFYR